jgi:putative membrane protein
VEDISFLLLLFSVFGGYLLGIISGLLPGIHNNNFALLLVALAPILAEKGLSPFYIAVIIISNSVAQTFHDDLR